MEGATGVLSKLTGQGVTRVLSVRYDFPEAWNTLLEGAPQVAIDIRDVHIPFFVSAFDLLVDQLAGKNTVYPSINFDGVATTASDLDGESGLRRLGRTQSVSAVDKHVMEITNWGSVSTEGAAGGPERLDGSKLKDIMLRVVLRRKAASNP